MHDRLHTDAAKAKMSASHRGKARPWKHRETREDGGVILYRCGRCLGFKPRDGFYRCNRTLLGLKAECKNCHRLIVQTSRDPEKVKAARRRSEQVRRARKAGSGGTVTEADWQKVLSILGPQCRCCGSADAPTQDHVIPLALGGRHEPLNLQPLCRSCNERKQARARDYRTADQLAALVVEFAVHKLNVASILPGGDGA